MNQYPPQYYYQYPCNMTPPVIIPNTSSTQPPASHMHPIPYPYPMPYPSPCYPSHLQYPCNPPFPRRYRRKHKRKYYVEDSSDEDEGCNSMVYASHLPHMYPCGNVSVKETQQ